MAMDVPPALPAAPTRLIDRFRAFIRSRNLAYRTEKTSVHWVLRYIRFHSRQHPEQLNARDLDAFLSHLAVQQDCSPATQKTALNALVFLYRVFSWAAARCPEFFIFAQTPTGTDGVQPLGNPVVNRPPC